MRFPRKVAALLAGVLLFLAAVVHAAPPGYSGPYIEGAATNAQVAAAVSAHWASTYATVGDVSCSGKTMTQYGNRWFCSATVTNENNPGVPALAQEYFYEHQPSCVAANAVGSLFARFATIDSPPDVTMANAASVTGIATAFYSLGDTPTVCYQGCVHDLIPLPTDPDGVYYKPSSGPYELYRGYAADRSNTVCTGPGNAGTSASISPVTSVTVAPVASSSSGTSTGGGTGSGCTAGDTRAGCAELGTPSDETIPGVTVTLPGFAPETQHFGSGQCPANVFMSFGGINKSLKIWDWQHACDVLVTYIKPMVLTLGALAAFFILLGMPQPGQVSTDGA